MTRENPQADVCLILEGTYPYVPGGVSGWVHELIFEQSHLAFHIIALLPPGGGLKKHYEIPNNVVGLTRITLQDLGTTGVRTTSRQRRKLFEKLEMPLLNLLTRARLKDLDRLLEILGEMGRPLGQDVLLNSKEAWVMLTRMYHTMMGNSSFLDYFWSWRALLGGLYSVLLADIPEADCYHSLCTGYAGLFLARIHQETGNPCLITEHGIYTNERRIEIASAEWLDDKQSLNLNVDRTRFEKNLRDFWIDTFISYSSLCYRVCDRIITLYEGNKELQLDDGADSEKLAVIPNGIDFERFSRVEKKPNGSPTIAFIGRVVPIKDVKTFIRACVIIRNSIPDINIYIMGPVDEDEEYYRECVDMVAHADLEDTISFTGKVDIAEHLSRVDLLVLTSLSEAQPLVILEAGAAGIPSVVTEVGACPELIEGRSDEAPKIGPGGIVCSLSSPQKTAQAVTSLLSDVAVYRQYSRNIRERVARYYDKKDQHGAYRELYSTFVGGNVEVDRTGMSASSSKPPTKLK
ncbi:MAG: DUF3492 domain-containing protein [Proteobacteria bacterium]|nr:DUF3492 domain-containing protein [Pseudomonadota bacterium]